jgi:mRNA (2'-O-methyladenosine-N6-)-methyltransferase
MCPGGKKVELFGRPQNCMPGWLTLGNQLPGVRLRNTDILERYRATYPEEKLT